MSGDNLTLPTHKTHKRKISFKGILDEAKSKVFSISPSKEITLNETSTSCDSPINIKQLEVFQDKKTKELFKLYTIELLMQEQFEYYELFHEYLEEKETEKKKEMEKELYEKYIDTKGTHTISLYHKIRTKVKKLYDNQSPKAFELVYKEVYNMLEPITKDFDPSKYTEKIKITKEKEKTKFPMNFDELITSKEAFKLFSNFVHENFGENYIECFNHVLYYKSQTNLDIKTQSFLITRIMERYCQFGSPKLCIFNSTVRDKIWKNELQKDWCQELYDFLYKILSHEYYSRFINTIVWKDYVNSNFTKEKDCKFEDLYQIKQIESEHDSFSEKVQVLSVVNKLTVEPFKAKRIVSSKAISKSEALEYLDQIPHDNIVQLIELFNEDLEGTYNKSCLTIVTTDLHTNLEDFIYKKLNEPLLEIELVDYMRQILLALEHFHKQKKYFEIGEFTEKKIYFSAMYGRVYVDHGFYNDEDIDEDDYPKYFEPPEQMVSEYSDIYAAGFIFFRLTTLYNSAKTQQIYDSKKRSGSIISIITENFQKRSSTTSKAYFANLKKSLLEFKTLYDPSILNIIIQMIDPNPMKRPKLKDIISELNRIYKCLRKSLSRKLSDKFGELTESQKALIQKPEYRKYFKEYLRTEYAVEPLLFFEDVQVFQKLETDQERLIKAKEICQSYLYTTSILEVNCSGKLKKEIGQELREAEQSGGIYLEIFDEISKHVSDTVILDTLMRFERSLIGIELSKIRGDEKEEKRKSMKKRRSTIKKFIK
eukprot:gene9113-1203_t